MQPFYFSLKNSRFLGSAKSKLQNFVRLKKAWNWQKFEPSVRNKQTWSQPWPSKVFISSSRSTLYLKNASNFFFVVTNLGCWTRKNGSLENLKRPPIERDASIDADLFFNRITYTVWKRERERVCVSVGVGVLGEIEEIQVVLGLKLISRKISWRKKTLNQIGKGIGV